MREVREGSRGVHVPIPVLPQLRVWHWPLFSESLRTGQMGGSRLILSFFGPEKRPSWQGKHLVLEPQNLRSDWNPSCCAIGDKVGPCLNQISWKRGQVKGLGTGLE